MSTIISALQNELDEAAYIIWVTRLCQVAALALVLYDHVITFGQEVRHIWKRLCPATVLYIIIRYVGDTVAITSTIALMVPPQSEKFCKIILGVEGWLPIIVLFAVQAVLQIRIYALCRRSKKVLSLMLAFYVAEMVTLIALVVEITRAAQVIEVPFLNIAICGGTQAITLSLGVSFAIVGFEGILFVLLLWVVVRHSSFSRGFFGRTIFEILVRGNVFYFACALMTCLFDVIIWKTLGEDYLQLTGAISDGIEVIVGCRLILNLHAALFRDTLSEI